MIFFENNTSFESTSLPLFGLLFNNFVFLSSLPCLPFALVCQSTPGLHSAPDPPVRVVQQNDRPQAVPRRSSVTPWCGAPHPTVDALEFGHHTSLPSKMWATTRRLLLVISCNDWTSWATPKKVTDQQRLLSWWILEPNPQALRTKVTKAVQSLLMQSWAFDSPKAGAFAASSSPTTGPLFPASVEQHNWEVRMAGAFWWAKPPQCYTKLIRIEKPQAGWSWFNCQKEIDPTWPKLKTFFFSGCFSSFFSASFFSFIQNISNMWQRSTLRTCSAPRPVMLFVDSLEAKASAAQIGGKTAFSGFPSFRWGWERRRSFGLLGFGCRLIGRRPGNHPCCINLHNILQPWHSKHKSLQATRLKVWIGLFHATDLGKGKLRRSLACLASSYQSVACWNERETLELIGNTLETKQTWRTLLYLAEILPLSAPDPLSGVPRLQCFSQLQWPSMDPHLTSSRPWNVFSGVFHSVGLWTCSIKMPKKWRLPLQKCFKHIPFGAFEKIKWSIRLLFQP